MRILLIHQYFLEKNDSGGSRFNEMAKLWVDKGHEVTVLSGMVHYATGKKMGRYKGKFTFNDSQFYNGVDVIRCHVSESYNSSFLGRLWAYFSFVFSSIYAGLFKVKKTHDIILVTSPPLFVGITAYVLSVFKRLPFIFEVRDLWPESAIDTGVLSNKWIIKFAYWFEGFIYHKAQLINVLTPAFKTKLLEKNIPKDKLIFIPNAADFSLSKGLLTDFNAVEFKNSLDFKGNFVVTYVGAHGVANHLIQLLEAAELLRDTQVIFQLIGAGMQKDMLIAQKQKRNLTNVIFRDPVPKEEIFKYILASDMGASVLKKADTFKTIYSNKTFDYMSCRIPVLLAIDGISRNLIEDAVCGIYVEPENPQAIAKAIRNAMSYPEKLKEMGENGYNFALGNFDRSILAERYSSHMQSLLK